MKRKNLTFVLSFLIVLAPLTMQRCGQGLDTDKTLKSTNYGASAGPSASPSYSGVFNPSKLADLKFWFDAGYFFRYNLTDASSISTVMTWGNGADNSLADYLAPSNASGTFHFTAGPNSTPTVRFNGAMSFNRGSSGVSSAEGLTVFAVGKRTAPTAGSFFAITSGAATFLPASDDFIKFGGTAGLTALEVNRWPNITFSSGSLAYDTEAHIYMGVWNPNAVGSEFFAFGSQLTSSSGSGVIASLPLTLSGSVYVGWDGASYLNGEMSELVVYKRALNLSEQNLVMDYLKTKYKL